jgi:Spy/CpxP family protein refolding chaperone
MKRPLASSGLALAALLISTLVASAQERGPIARSDRGGAAPAARLEGIVRCLSIVNLSSDQKAAIAGVIAATRPSLEADAQALRADREKLRSDIESGADKCVIGQDALNAHADGEKLRTALAAVRDQVLAQLTPDQQSQLKGCLQAPRGAGRPGAASSE